MLTRGSVRYATPLAVTLSVALATATAIDGAERTGKKAFTSAWEDRAVVLTRTLYSIVYDERSRYLPLVKHDGRVTGLTVATPSDTYYQFDARRKSEDDIIARDPDRLVSILRTQYRRSENLDIGNVQDVEPVMLVRYEPGVKLVVRRIQFDRDRVRLSFNKTDTGDLATTLTVKWPAPLSKDLTESRLIDDVLTRFVTRQ